MPERSWGSTPKPSEFPVSAGQFLDALGKASKRFFHVLYCHGFCTPRTQRVFENSQIRNPLLMQLFHFFDLWLKYLQIGVAVDAD